MTIIIEFLLTCTFAIFGLHSATKNYAKDICFVIDESIGSNSSIYTDIHDNLIDITIKITAKIHRAKEVLNNGRECGCDACFGLCEGRIEIDINPLASSSVIGRLNASGGVMTLHILNMQMNAGDILYIDEDVELHNPNLAGFSKFTVKSGEYKLDKSGGVYSQSGIIYNYWAKTNVYVDLRN